MSSDEQLSCADEATHGIVRWFARNSGQRGGIHTEFSTFEAGPRLIHALRSCLSPLHHSTLFVRNRPRHAAGNPLTYCDKSVLRIRLRQTSLLVSSGSAIPDPGPLQGRRKILRSARIT